MNDSIGDPNKLEVKTSNTEREITDKNSRIIVLLVKSKKLSYKTLYWTALVVSFAALIIAGVAAAYVIYFRNFNNNVAIAICSCVIICCAFICATLLLVFYCKYLYSLKKASNQTKSTEILENAYMKCFQGKDTGKTATVEEPSTENNDTGDTAETQSNGDVSASN